MHLRSKNSCLKFPPKIPCFPKIVCGGQCGPHTINRWPFFFVFWSRTISFGPNVPKFFSRKVAFLQHYTGTPVTFRSKNYQLSLVYLQNHTKEHMEKSKMPAGRPFFLLITILAQNIYQKWGPEGWTPLANLFSCDFSCGFAKQM